MRSIATLALALSLLGLPAAAGPATPTAAGIANTRAALSGPQLVWWRAGVGVGGQWHAGGAHRAGYAAGYAHRWARDDVCHRAFYRPAPVAPFYHTIAPVAGAAVVGGLDEAAMVSSITRAAAAGSPPPASTTTIITNYYGD
jgi:hypothetical protein